MTTHLTIIGDRQHGKSEMLLRYALDEASGGKSVLFTSPNRTAVKDAFTRASERASHDFINLEKIVRSNGKEAILFDTGGRIVFSTHEGRGLVVDVHILDDSNAEPHPSAQHVVRSARR